ncbi:anhydro-N-acetylmuramic acid kinase [Lacinutrix sp. Bg11-31]|uniref:anhydro-N-acetylmuramic acid kinase n=1 Tax=Lacinutrix sp. Bg11-31 TaxID=2057808 RepID=UPI000C311023|nr:anhydro-N-acetylmuramic acid kinase [Lacinutrix sp. Bg11-31]AUC80606.1 anhydro-N-acetylmuramic acid kinase [Lacinutrix sp. Bg11-31]
MIKKEYNIIGVMSGTSLDGIDLAFINFYFKENWSFKIVKAETIAYAEEWLGKLKTLIKHSKEELKELDTDYTLYLAEVIDNFIKINNISSIDAICSHGHTALHKPENGLTYQIGNLPILAKILNQTIVCDFRVQDVQFGGQGAPLVPIGDQLLFSEYNYCVNLGGFANVSTEIKGQRIAFDICPVNIVLNRYVSILGFAYDNKGALAKEGTINNDLLNELNNLKFYNETYPKSLGLEWVNEIIFPIIDSYKLSVKDVLRTFVEHVAIQISNVLNSQQNASVLITGGGVFNSFLMSRIEYLCNNTIQIPSKEIIEFKEALIFGFLGVLKLRGENNSLASVTGAKKDHSSGVIFQS